jgi:hypothetical protein
MVTDPESQAVRREQRSRRSTIAAEALVQTALPANEDHREGRAAARERRPPTFKARQPPIGLRAAVASGR